MLLYFKLHMIDKIINFNFYSWISLPEEPYMSKKKKSVRAMIKRKIMVIFTSFLFLHEVLCFLTLGNNISGIQRNKNCTTCFG